jgi:hypothetical protein
MAADRCQRCGDAVSPDEIALGWPVYVEPEILVCPSCYGDDAFCSCGATLRGDSDCERCDDCDSVATLQSWAAQQAAYLAELWEGDDYGDGEDGGDGWLKEGIDFTDCPDPEIRDDPNAAFALIEPLFVAALDE